MEQPDGIRRRRQTTHRTNRNVPSPPAGLVRKQQVSEPPPATSGPLDLGAVADLSVVDRTVQTVSELDRRSDRRLDERVRHRPGQSVDGLPARAMRRHDDTDVHPGERRDGLADDWLEQTTREVQPADEPGDPLLAGQSLGVP